MMNTAIAFSNIAFIKYWGNRDDRLRLPKNGSISMNLGDLFSKTSIEIDSSLLTDEVLINNHPADEASRARVSAFLDIIRAWSGQHQYAKVISQNNFPSGAGIASSASGFAALSLAGAKAYNLNLSPQDQSRLARRGSGSACRSIPGGFVEWNMGDDDSTSFAVSIAPSTHWDLIDLVMVIEDLPKKVGSTAGHSIASTSIFQDCRLADSDRRLAICREAIISRDFEKLAEMSELDSNLMHAVMMTSTPPLFYWSPSTLHIMKFIVHLRNQGYPVFYTIDAGPNVHVITEKQHKDKILSFMKDIPGIQFILSSQVGGAARLIEE